MLATILILAVVGGHPVDLDAVHYVEAGGRLNPPDGAAGEKGPFQFMKATWNWIRPNKRWSFSKDAYNYHRARKTADRYFNWISRTVDRDLRKGRVRGTKLALCLAYYNAGRGTCLKVKGVPRVVRPYVAKYRRGLTAAATRPSRARSAATAVSR